MDDWLAILVFAFLLFLPLSKMCVHTHNCSCFSWFVLFFPLISVCRVVNGDVWHKFTYCFV